MLQPAAGTLVSGRSVDQLADQVLPITEATGLTAPASPTTYVAWSAMPWKIPTLRMQAVLVLEEALRALPPVDEEGCWSTPSSSTSRATRACSE